MAILVIDVQYKENYGAHDWNGEGDCPQYWKFKGGSSYKVQFPFDVDYEWAKIYAERVIDSFQSEITWSNDYDEQYVIGWSLREDGWLSDFEKSQLEWDGEIRYPEPVLEYKEAA